MKFYLFIIFACFQITAFAQSRDPRQITPKMEQEFRQGIENRIVQMKKKLANTSETEMGIQFIIDTFRIESFYRKCIETDYSTAGMNSAAFRAAQEYDSLLNIYYKKLLAVLKGDDKQILIKAQKAWIAHRDSEQDLVAVLGKEEYAGGGTMQSLVDSSSYLEMVRKRTIEIVSHLRRAIQDYN